MFQIAIDGPAGSGKSTIAKLVAKELGFVYVSTGKYYRAYAYIIDSNNLSLNEFLKLIDTYEIVVDQNQVFINNKDISVEINSEKIGQIASEIATNKDIRNHAIKLQKKIAQNFNVVMDGRDIGTVVLPNAQLKIFLIANSEIRAKRRIKELGLNLDSIEKIKKEIEERDFRDKNREIDPLVKAKNAIIIDSSYLTLDEVKEQIITLYKQRI
ncbi:(d)CMP kinase [Mycoplasmoides alvi]|uniref:(d)CMP kinase n=1 Tax=Mycoplasmoides alvi TaxID=78580 RepID=UPI00051BC808|nr:(d)CMP kinase [Mycoplasmoides alvi]